MEHHSRQTLTKEENGLQMERKVSNRVSNVSARRTRSQAEPDWSMQEMLTLVNEIAAIELDFRKTLSSYQKWKMITDNCNSLGITRPLNQCRRKWDLLVAEYQKIRDWGYQSGTESYWTLGSERKMEVGLPVSFEKELFESIDEHFKALVSRSNTEKESDSELNGVNDLGSKKKRRGRVTQLSKSEESQEEMAAKLREHAELIQAIAGGNLNESICNNVDDLKNPVEFKRRQGSELIKVLGGLVDILDQVSDSVQKNV